MVVVLLLICKPWLIHKGQNNIFYIKGAKYEIQNPSTRRETLFRLSFGGCFAFFILCDKLVAQHIKTFVWGWRKLLQKAKRESTLSNKFWLCCSFFIKLETCLVSTPSKSTTQRAAYFFQSATTVFVSRQVYDTRWKTRNIDPKHATKQCCAVSWGLLYLVFRHHKRTPSEEKHKCKFAKQTPLTMNAD